MNTNFPLFNDCIIICTCSFTLPIYKNNKFPMSCLIIQLFLAVPYCLLTTIVYIFIQNRQERQTSPSLFENKDRIISKSCPSNCKKSKKYCLKSSCVQVITAMPTLEIPVRALISTQIYDSAMYRRLRKEYRRGNHHILFHTPHNS